MALGRVNPLRLRQSILSEGLQDCLNRLVPDVAHAADVTCSQIFGASQDDLRELSFVATLRALDASWWDLRKELDRYLDTYDEYLRLSPQLWQSCRTEKYCERETETERVGRTGKPALPVCCRSSKGNQIKVASKCS